MARKGEREEEGRTRSKRLGKESREWIPNQQPLFLPEKGFTGSLIPFRYIRSPGGMNYILWTYKNSTQQTLTTNSGTTMEAPVLQFLFPCVCFKDFSSSSLVSHIHVFCVQLRVLCVGCTCHIFKSPMFWYIFVLWPVFCFGNDVLCYSTRLLFFLLRNTSLLFFVN